MKFVHFWYAELRVLTQKFLGVNKYPQIQYLIAKIYPLTSKGTIVFKYILKI